MIKIEITRDRIFLALILALAGFLSFFAVWNEGYSNAYYAAAVRSMLTGFGNFFFVSFDPGGFVTVDKPPLGLWIQTLSAIIFGFHGWSLILPQALATVVSTALVYHLVRRTFGNPAGLISALVFALTPVVVAVSRTNNLDAMLVMFLLFAAWAVIIAAERGSLKWLLAGMALVGLGFNVKMLQAFGVVPAFLLMYMLSPAIKLPKKLGHITIALVFLLIVSLSWAVIVDLTPADQRPYVGSSQTNSVIELALGYNGIQRVVPGGSPMSGNPVSGNDAGTSPGMPDGGMPQNGMPALPGGESTSDGRQSSPGGPMQGGMGGPGGEGGSAGPFRLLNEQMAGQISWLLPMAILGFFAAWLTFRKSRDETDRPKLRSSCFWGMWMLPMLVYFSIAGFFHRYYLITIAPSIAALCGIGITVMWNEYGEPGWKSYLLPLSLIVTACVQAVFLLRYPQYSYWLIPVTCAVSITSAAVLLFAKSDRSGLFKGILRPLAVLGFAALLLAPAIWSATPIVYHTEATLPYAGPELSFGIATASANTGNTGQGTLSPGTGPGMGLTNTTGLVRFLLDNTENERYIVAVPNAMLASSIIIETGKPVMAVGGFIGSDPILTADELEEMVNNGEVRYFLTQGIPDISSASLPDSIGVAGDNRTGNMSAFGGMPGMMGGGQGEITEWVKSHGTVVPSSEWMGEQPASQTGGGGFGMGMGSLTLYDMKGGE